MSNFIFLQVAIHCSNTVGNTILLPLNCVGNLIKIQLILNVMIYLWSFNFIPLIYIFIFMPVKCYLDYCLPTLVVLFPPKVGYSGSVIFPKVIFKMFIFLYFYIQYYSVFFSDLQHSGQKVVYFTEWPPPPPLFQVLTWSHT